MTSPALPLWPVHSGPHLQSEVSAVIGSGDALWARAASDILCWKVKTASGFKVSSSATVRAGDRTEIYAGVLGIRVVEPVEVLEVIKTPDRVGFSYGTLPGHPVTGEEAFIVERLGDEIRLTIRSLTSPSPQQPWRALFPLLLVVQKLVRHRYLRSLS